MLALSTATLGSPLTPLFPLWMDTNQLLEALPTLPVGIVVEPVCNLLQARGMKAVDLGLMHLQHVLAAHPRLSLRTGLKLAEAAGQIVIKGAVFRTTAAQVLHALLKRFQSAQSMVAFLQHWAAAALVIAYQVGEQQHDVQPAASPRRRGEARGKRGKRQQRRETSAGREGETRYVAPPPCPSQHSWHSRSV